jgi:hypothetical protein
MHARRRAVPICCIPNGSLLLNNREPELISRVFDTKGILASGGLYTGTLIPIMSRLLLILFKAKLDQLSKPVRTPLCIIPDLKCIVQGSCMQPGHEKPIDGVLPMANRNGTIDSIARLV